MWELRFLWSLLVRLILCFSSQQSHQFWYWLTYFIKFASHQDSIIETWPRVNSNFFSVPSITLNRFHNLNFSLFAIVNSHIAIMSASKQQSDSSSSPPRRGRPPSSTLNPSPLHTFLPSLSNENNSHQKYVPLPPRQRVSRPTAQNKPNWAPSVDVWQILIDDFNYRKHAAMTFSPKLSDFITRVAVKQFQLYLAEVASDLKHVCTSCGFFISVAEVTRLHRADLIF